jgi:hypothetical protein
MTPEIRYLVKEQAKGTNHTNDRDRLKVEEDPVLLPVDISEDGYRSIIKRWHASNSSSWKASLVQHVIWGIGRLRC